MKKCCARFKGGAGRRVEIENGNFPIKIVLLSVALPFVVEMLFLYAEVAIWYWGRDNDNRKNQLRASSVDFLPSKRIENVSGFNWKILGRFSIIGRVICLQMHLH